MEPLLVNRRLVLAAGGTLLAGAFFRKHARAETVEMRPLSAIVRIDPPGMLPKIQFFALDGTPGTLADYAGRGMVLNFWATWCGPCVAELPELDRLAASNPGFAVVAVSADRGGAALVKPFLQAHGLSHAIYLLDSGNAAVHAMGVFSFPTSFIIDRHGALRGRLEGPAAWSAAAGVVAGLVG